MNIKWPPEKTFEYGAHTKALREGKEDGIQIAAENTPRREKEVEER